MLDDAFKKTPAKKQSVALGIFGKPTGKKVAGLMRSRKPTHRKVSPDMNLPSINRRKPTSLVPYGTGRQGIFETPWVTPAPKQTTSMTIFSPKQVVVRRQPAKQKAGSNGGFNFNNPYGSTASQPSGFGVNYGSSQPLGSSSGIKAGKRHKGTTVGGVGTPKRGGGIKAAVGSAVGKAKRPIGFVVKPIGRGALKVAGFGDTKAQKQKTRASIGKQFRRGIHSTLFKGKKRLI